MRSLVFVALLGVAAPAAGQVPPAQEPATPATPAEPETPPPPPPLNPPEQVSAPALLDPGPGRGPRWLLRLGVYPAWDSNVRLDFPETTVGSGDASDFVGRGAVDLARHFSSPRSDLAVALQANGAAYLESDDLNEAGYGASVRGTHRPSPRTTLRATGSFGDGYARDISRVVAPGLALPLERARALGATAGVGFGLGAKSSASLDGSYRAMRFDREDISDGSQATLAARLVRQLGARAEGDLTYELDRERWQEGGPVETPPPVTAHSVFLGLGGTPSRGVQLKGSFGILYLPGSADAPSEVSPSGAASLSFSSRRSRVEASYSRDPQLAYGYGRSTITDNGRLGYRLAVGRQTALLCGATYGWSRDPQDPLFRLVNVTASAGLSTVFGRGYEAGLTYAYTSRDYRAGDVEPQVGDSHAIGVSFSRQWTW